VLKITLAVVALALAGTASAGGWRKLSIDASSEAAFKESVATFQDKLSPSRRVAFDQSLQDIRNAGMERARAEQREYTNEDYLRQLDGLGYEEVIRVTDPSGEKAQRYRAQYYYARGSGLRGTGNSFQPMGPHPGVSGSILESERIPYRGFTDLTGPGPGVR
jgi:uncharacterized membrane protein